MSDPLSITSSILAVVGAAKQLHNFIERIKEAPDVLERTKSDLILTVKTFEELRNYLHTRPSDNCLQESVLQAVLTVCMQRCEAFQKLLDNLVRHSDQVSFRDKMRLAQKEDDIEDRRKELGYARESVGIAVSCLIL